MASDRITTINHHSGMTVSLQGSGELGLVSLRVEAGESAFCLDLMLDRAELKKLRDGATKALERVVLATGGKQS